jgi:hypothetical protein
MKNKTKITTRSKSARSNGRADNDTKEAGEDISFSLLLPAGAFERISERVASFSHRKPRQH